MSKSLKEKRLSFKRSHTKDADNLNVDMKITKKDMINELSHKNTIFEDPEIQTPGSNNSPDNSFNRVLFLKKENSVLKTQGTINSNIGKSNKNNFDSFDKSKQAIQGNMCSNINSAMISVNSQDLYVSSAKIQSPVKKKTKKSLKIVKKIAIDQKISKFNPVREVGGSNESRSISNPAFHPSVIQNSVVSRTTNNQINFQSQDQTLMNSNANSTLDKKSFQFNGRRRRNNGTSFIMGGNTNVMVKRVFVTQRPMSTACAGKRRNRTIRLEEADDRNDMSLSEDENSKVNGSNKMKIEFQQSEFTRDMNQSPPDCKEANLKIKTPQMKSHKVGGSFKMGKTLNALYSSNKVSSVGNSIRALDQLEVIEGHPTNNINSKRIVVETNSSHRDPRQNNKSVFIDKHSFLKKNIEQIKYIEREVTQCNSSLGNKGLGGVKNGFQLLNDLYDKTMTNDPNQRPRFNSERENLNLYLQNDLPTRKHASKKKPNMSFFDDQTSFSSGITPTGGSMRIKSGIHRRNQSYRNQVKGMSSTLQSTRSPRKANLSNFFINSDRKKEIQDKIQSMITVIPQKEVTNTSEQNKLAQKNEQESDFHVSVSLDEESERENQENQANKEQDKAPVFKSVFQTDDMKNQNPQFKGTISQISNQIIQRGSIISSMNARKRLFNQQSKQSTIAVTKLDAEENTDHQEVFDDTYYNEQIKQTEFKNNRLESSQVIDDLYGKCAEDLMLPNKDEGESKIDELVLNIARHQPTGSHMAKKKVNETETGIKSKKNSQQGIQDSAKKDSELLESPQKGVTDSILEDGVMISEYTAFLNEILSMRINDIKIEEKSESKQQGETQRNQEKLAKEQKKKEELLSIFNKACVMMQAHLSKEVIKMEANSVAKFKTKRFLGSFLTIPCKRKGLPLFLGSIHSGYSSSGKDQDIQIYWSRKNMYPSQENCEGFFIGSYDVKPVKKEEKIVPKMIQVDVEYTSVEILDQLVKEKLIKYEKLRQKYKITVKNSKNQYRIEKRIGLNVCSSKLNPQKDIYEEMVLNYQIQPFGEKSFNAEQIYIGVYSMIPDQQVSMTCSFVTNNCKNILKQDQDPQKEDHHEHHHDHGPKTVRFKKRTECSDCLICNGFKNKDFKGQIATHLEDIISDKTTYLQFIDNLDLVQRRVNEKRQVFIEEMQSRKNQIMEMEKHREAIKPYDMKMDEFKLNMVKDRKEQQSNERFTKKVFLAIKFLIIKQMKHNETLKAVKLNSDRQRLRRLLTLIYSNTIFMRFVYNYRTDKNKRDGDLLSKRASLRIYMKMARFIKKRGVSYEVRNRSYIRQQISFQCYMLVGKNRSPLYQKALDKLRAFLNDWQKKHNFILKADQFHNRIKNIQKKFKATHGFFLRHQEEIYEDMRQSLILLSEIERKHSKKFSKSHKTFKDVINKLRQNTDAFRVDEMDVDDFGRAYRYKNIIIQVVKDYMSFSKQMLMMKIIRWYGQRNQKSGVFNKDGLVEIMMRVSKTNQQFIQLSEKASKSYPGAEALRKLGNSKKEKKAESLATEKKGAKSKDKKKEAKGEVSEQPELQESESQMDGLKTLSVTSPNGSGGQPEKQRTKEEQQLSLLLGDKKAKCKKKHKMSAATRKLSSVNSAIANTLGKSTHQGLVQQDQQFKNEDLSEEKLKQFCEDNELPWEEEFLNYLEPPVYQNDIDRGEGHGGSLNLLTLLYRAFEIVKERCKEEEHKEKLDEERFQREFENMEEDLGGGDSDQGEPDSDGQGSPKKRNNDDSEEAEDE